LLAVASINGAKYSDSAVTVTKNLDASNMPVTKTETRTQLRVDASPTKMLWTKLSNGTAPWPPVTQLAPGGSLFTQNVWTRVTSIQLAPAGHHIMYDITATVPYVADG